MTEYCSNFNKKNGICDIKSQHMNNCYSDPSFSVNDKQKDNNAVKESYEVLDQSAVVDDNLFGVKKERRTSEEMDHDEKISVYKDEDISNNEDEEYSDIDEAYSDNEDEVGEDSNYTDEDEKVARHENKANLNEKVKKPKRVKQKVVEYKTAGLSSYEKMIEEKRKERIAFLQSINIDEAKVGLCAAVRSKKKKYKRRIKETNDNHQPVRRSIRPKNTVDFSEKALIFNQLFVKTPEKLKISPQKHWSKRIKTKFSSYIRKKELLNTRALENIEIPPSRRSSRQKKVFAEESLSVKAMERIEENTAFEISFKEALEPEKSYEDYIKDVNLQESNSEPKFHPYDVSTLRNLPHKGSKFQITCGQIYALTWYPSIENFVIAVGDQRGNIIIWNVGSDTDSYLFNVHSKRISHMQFNPFNPVQLISSSYDGTLCVGDMMKQKFYELYNISHITYCTYFDFLSSEGYLVGLTNGQVAIVDERSDKSASIMRHNCHYPYGVKTVNVHPVNKNLFVTTGNSPSAIRLWDLRNLKAEPIDEIREQNVYSAFFSPITGKSILSTAENVMCVFDSTNLSEPKKRVQSDKEPSFACKATWLPHSEEAFVRNRHNPNRIEVYDKDINLHYKFIHHFRTTSYVFHPFRPTLALGSSDGKLSIFS